MAAPQTRTARGYVPTRRKNPQLRVESLEDRTVPALVANGLLGQYFNGPDLTNPIFVRQDPVVNFTWFDASPDVRVPPDGFSARWTGLVEPRFSETYTFETQSDDGIRLWVDGRLLIDQWNDHPETTHRGQIDLQAGRRYDLRLEYYERGGGALARLFWSSPSQAREVIPEARLFAPVHGGNQYTLTSVPMGWADAQAEAQRLGGNLVAINSAAEEAWLKGALGTAEEFWIGLTDTEVEGEFRWVTGEPLVYANWTPGEPNNLGDEDFITMNNNGGGQWNDWPAATFRGVIEVPAGADTPTSPGVLRLAASSISVNEAAGTVSVGIERREGAAGRVTIDYRTVPVSASDGADFTGTSGTLVFEDGERFKTVAIPIENDADAEAGEQFNFVIDRVTGGAALMAPRTSIVTVFDDDSALTRLFGYDSFAGATGLAVNGATGIVGPALRLTGDVGYTAGTAFHQAAVAVRPDTSFATQFAFQVGGGAGGADGFAFILHNAPDEAIALGAVGGGLGYDGIGDSLAIEFDTYQNVYDPDDNHLSVLVGGNVWAPLATAPSDTDFNGGDVVHAWVDYDGLTDRLAVYVSADGVKPAEPALVATFELARLVGDRAYVGFGAGTGGLVNTHDVLDWQFAADSRLVRNDTAPPTVTAETLFDGLHGPAAIDWSPDGRNMYISELRGVVKVVRDGEYQQRFVLDFQDRVNNTQDRGLMDIAVHPNLAEHPYLYLLYTYDPPEVYEYPDHLFAGPDRPGNRAGRMSRVTLDAATDYTTIVPESEVVILGRNSTWDHFDGFVSSMDDLTVPPGGILPDGTNVPDFIAMDSDSHTVGAVEFGPDGMLWVTSGDGTSFNRVDPRTVRVQDIDNLSGKLLRIDPITGAGLADNPFYDGHLDSNRSKVYQLGIRNSFRMGIDPVTGAVYMSEVGWSTWEEINTGPAGANFGWPYYEGASGVSLRTVGYEDLPEAQAFYAAGTEVTPALLALHHLDDGINAIIIGDVYRGSAYPGRYQGNLFFNDLGQGVVRTAQLDADGKVAAVEVFATGHQYVVQMKVGPDGLMYFVDLDNGVVGRWHVGS